MDSNGPDVKIRGTASHIFEKYQTLARDAGSAGDRVKAENYLQHAEHYFRILRAANGSQPKDDAVKETGARGGNGHDLDGADDGQAADVSLADRDGATETKSEATDGSGVPQEPKDGQPSGPSKQGARRRSRRSDKSASSSAKSGDRNPAKEGGEGAGSAPQETEEPSGDDGTNAEAAA